MNICKWTNRTYPLFSDDCTVGEILSDRKSAGLTYVISVDSDGRLAGVARVDDIKDVDPATPVSEVITDPVFYCRDSDFIEDAARMLIESHDYVLPVVDDDFLVVGANGFFEILEGQIEFTAMDKPGTRVSVILEDKPGRCEML
jgi:acetoin utilization protein AcuB